MSDAAVRRLTVICTMSCKEALIELVPVFEHERGYSVDVVYGAGAGLARKIADGLRGDVFVGPEEFSGQLIEQGVLDGNSRSAFANSGAVIAVKAGTPIPDIGTAEKLRDVLLAAKGVSYSTGASGIHFLQACEQLGILAAVTAKLVRPQPGEMVGPVLVRGEAQIGVQQPAELLPEPGVVIVGYLPPEVRQTIVYGATAFPDPVNREGYAAFLEVMRSPIAREVLSRTGLDPI
jgi:molybdate transport system substrate-binding protein